MEQYKGLSGNTLRPLTVFKRTLGFPLLKKQHVLWTKPKMNARIAAQTPSSSVASAIDFLWEQTDLPEFKW